jgi:hypothetical protein
LALEGLAAVPVAHFEGPTTCREAEPTEADESDLAGDDGWGREIFPGLVVDDPALNDGMFEEEDIDPPLRQAIPIPDWTKTQSLDHCPDSMNACSPDTVCAQTVASCCIVLR